MEAKLIDFHAKFMEEFLAWCKAHPEEAAPIEDGDAAGELFYEKYDEWLEKPQDWLGGRSPNEYFDGFDDPQMLVSIMIEYIRADMDLPEPLFHAFHKLSVQIYPILLGIIMSDEGEDISADELLALQGHIVSLFCEMDMEHPIDRYIDMLAKTEEDSDFAEEATEVLFDEGEAIKEKLMALYVRTKGYGRFCFIDLLAGMCPDERIYTIMKDEFAAQPQNRAFLASCFERYGDDRAVPMLKAAINDDKIDYFLFRELKNAIESLSGEEIEERDFSGDELYDLLAEDDDVK